MSKNEFVYYNIDVQNKTPATVSATFNETRANDILDRSGDYNLGIIRFTLPQSAIPINHNADKILDTFTVGFTRGVFSTTRQVSYVNMGNSSNYIWTYQDITEAINTALYIAFVDLLALDGTITATQAPELVFNEQTGLFFLKIQTQFLTDVIRIQYNQEMHNYFQFPSVLSGVLYDIRYGSYGDNTDAGFIRYYQNYKTAILFTDLKNIIFETDRIPVQEEMIGGIVDKSINILTDFDPLQSDAGNATRLSFFPQGPIRWYGLNGDMPLRTIDIKIYYTTSTDDLKRPVLLKPYQFANVKLEFRRKDINV